MRAQSVRSAEVRGSTVSLSDVPAAAGSQKGGGHINLCSTSSLGYDRAAVMKRITDRAIMTEAEESLTMGAVCHVSPGKSIGAGATKTTILLTSRIAPMESLR